MRTRGLQKLFAILPALLPLVGASPVSGAAPELDPGGVSVDVTCAVPEKTGEDVRNLVANGDFSAGCDTVMTEAPGWKKFFCAHQADAAPELKAAVDNFMTNRRVGGANPYYLLKTSDDACKYQDAQGAPMISNRVNQEIVWDGSPERLKFTCRLRGGFMSGRGFKSFRLFAYFWGDTKYKPIAEEVNQPLPLEKEFREVSHEFNVPAGTKRILLQLSLYGEGEAAIDDVRLRRVAAAGVEAALMPYYLYPQDAYHLESGAPACLLFMYRRHDDRPFAAPRLTLDLPEAFVPLDVDQPNQIVENVVRDGRRAVKIDFSKVAERNRPNNGYQGWGSTTLMLKTTLPASGQTFDATYTVENNGVTGKSKSFKLNVMPRLDNLRSPQRFLSGTYGFNLQFGDDATGQILDYYRKSGFNAIQSQLNDAAKQRAERLNISTFGDIYHLANGYRMGVKPKPASASYIQADGKPLVEKHADAALICPVEVYNRGPYYRDAVVDDLLKDYMLKRRAWTYMMPNWEVIAGDKGCFCERCRDEFIRYSKLPPDEIKAIWPSGIILKHYGLWCKFRSWQHGKLVATVDEDVRNIAASIGKKGGLIPVIEFGSVTSWYNPDFRAYNPVDYLDKVTGIEPFGPYFFHQVGGASDQYYPGIHFLSHAAARECMDFVAKHVPDPAKRPRLIAYPHGIQGVGESLWITEPEAITFDTLCFYVNGYQGSFAYFFPAGYDQRYFQAMRWANHQIACSEDLVLGGEPDNGFFGVQPLTALPVGDIYNSYRQDDYLFQILRQPKVGRVELLLSCGFRSGVKRLVALGNAWVKGEIFAKLAVPGLSTERRWRVSLPDREITLGAFDAKTLADGITVHVGALRWNFFLIEPEDAAAVGGYSQLTQDSIRKTLAERGAAIQAAAKLESAAIQAKSARNASRFRSDTDYGKLAPLKNGGVEFNADAAKHALVVSAGTYRAELMPEKGGALLSLRIEGREQVHVESGLGIGRDNFIYPAAAAQLPVFPYRVESVEAVDIGVRIVLAMELDEDKSQDFNRVALRKVCDFGRDSITFRTTLTNRGNTERTFAFRFHNIPEALAVRSGQAGDVVLGAEKTRVSRVFAPRLFRLGAAPRPEIDKILDFGDKVEQMHGGSAMLTPSLTLDATPAQDLYGIFFWETPASGFATVEFLYQPITLKPEQSWSAALSIAVSQP